MKSFLNDGLDLSTVELIELVCSKTLERQLAVIFAHSALQLHDFTIKICESVVVVEHNHHCVVLTYRFVEVLYIINLTEN